MASSRHSRYVAILRDRQRSHDRFVDLAISLRVSDLDTTGDDPVYLEHTDEVLVEVGGRWDRKSKRWSALPTQTVRIVRVPRGSDQEQPARWLAEWFRRYARSPKDGPHWRARTAIPGPTNLAVVEFVRVFTLILVGGRRGGKTHLAVVALCMMAVLTPRSILWAISPTQDETAEIEAATRELVPREWFSEHRGQTNKILLFKFANGSRLTFLSGHKPRALKRGRVDLALYNEGQNMPRAGWTQLRGAIADRGGLVMIACNPPTESIGRWIEEIHDQARAGTIEAQAFHFRAANNPWVNAAALESMRREVDEVTARKEIDGEMGVPIGDVVLYAWSDAESIREVPAHLVDITAEVTRKELGRAAGYVVGLDLQRTPHIPAIVYRFYRDPAYPDDVIAWIVDEVVVEDADENDLLDALEALNRWTPAGRVAGDGYRGWIAEGDDPDHPSHCAVVVDASAWWQDSEHTKGRTTDKMLRARNWTWLYKPQKDSDRNPDIIERVKITNARLKTGDGRRRMFSRPENSRTNLALRSWENRNGVPSRTGDFTHIGDAASYVVVRFFGRPKINRSGGAPYRPVRRFTRGDDVRRM